jgi:1,2-phenylacetyl-CoA epoxidase catalytic subunit
LVGHPLCEDAYEIRHRSGEWLGTAPTLTAARELIDGSIVLVRQRLAMTA